MKPKFLFSLMAVAVLIASAASAQTSSASSNLPAAPGAAASDPAVPTLSPTNKGVASVNVEGALFNTNEGKREIDALQKKFEPKSNELKSQNDEIEALKKKLSTATADAKPELQREIEQKQKSLDRAAQDAREDFQTQQNEIGQKLLAKLAPVIIKIANQSGAGVVLDTSQPWPQGLVLITGAGVDITTQVIEAYNAQSGVAAPAPRSGATKPSGSGTSRPSGAGTTKPSAPSSKPATTTPPGK